MKCTLAGDKARVLAKFLQFLFKIGPDLYMEAVEEGLILGTANNSSSGFARIHLWPSFFSDFDVKNEDLPNGENFCRVSLKACVPIFRSMKNVETCDIRLKSRAGKLIIQLHCRQNTTKTHFINVLEQETLSAPTRHGDSSLNSLTASHKVFGDILTVFSTNEEELTIEATRNKICIKNYLEALHVNRQQMRTDLSLDPAEFDTYVIENETSLTFCLKEWRAFLLLAESLNSTIAINFETTGLPIEFGIQDLDMFEVTLFMSTLSTDLDCSRNLTGVSVPAASQVTNKKRPHELNVDEELNALLKKPKGRTKRPKTPESKIQYSNPDIDDFTNNESHEQSIGIGASSSLTSPINQNRWTVVRNEEGNRLELPTMSNTRATVIPPRPASQHQETNDLEVIFLKDTEEDDTLSNIPMEPNVDFRVNPTIQTSLETVRGSTADDVILVPESPVEARSQEKRKVALSLFRRCYEPSFKTANMTGMGNILAENSDEDNE